MVIRFLYIFNNLFQKNLLTINSDSDILCLEGVSTQINRVLIKERGVIGMKLDERKMKIL